MSKLKTGDRVVMINCLEASLPKNKGKVWICRGDEFPACSGDQVVFLEGYSGYFCREYLMKLKEAGK